MFTGIIKYQTKVFDRIDKNGILSVSFATPKGLRLSNGKSLNINGICSTVKKVRKNNFTIDYMPETRSKTTVNGWQKGTTINLEESLRADSLLDGHIVQGHIDATGTIRKIEQKGDSKIFTIQTKKEFLKFIAPKGSICIDGISLTITKTRIDNFSVALIPYTLKNTNANDWKTNDQVNIETDVLARYLYNFKKS